MAKKSRATPDNTAERVALWRALHCDVDEQPHVCEDRVGLQLLAPTSDWRKRGDMHPLRTARNRASTVARVRFVEDHLQRRIAQGVDQYVILGAGLDTFSQRRPELAANLAIFEIDRAHTQTWKQKRLDECGYDRSQMSTFVPVDFEAGERWLDKLAAAGFDGGQPSVIASTGVIMYLSKKAIIETFRTVANLAKGTSFVVSFMLPFDRTDPSEKVALSAAERGARARGTPFVSYFAPEEIIQLARDTGFARVSHISSAHLTDAYFSGRCDGLRPSSAEEVLVAWT